VNRRRFLQASGAGVGLALRPLDLAWPSQAMDRTPSSRALVVYTDPRLGAAGQRHAGRIASAASASPLLRALAERQPVVHLDPGMAQAQLADTLAYNHLLLIGMPDDLIIQQAWQREALITAGSMYAFGYGNLRGSLGYVESDRSLFLHAASVPKAPYECQVITVSGTDTDGIGLAIDALVNQGLVNGIVARSGKWNRPTPTLLDRDPLPDGFSVPTRIPLTLGGLNRIALIQASEDEYRGVLMDTQVEPVSIWRAKYYAPGQWDGAGEVSSFHNYVSGLHRRAYGNTVWMATFASESVAASVAPLIAKAAGCASSGTHWQGKLAPHAWGIVVMGDSPQPGSLDLWVAGDSVLLSSQTVTG
jgi:hypothetical protein